MSTTTKPVEHTLRRAMEPHHGQATGPEAQPNRLTHDTVQHTDGGDTDLDRGQESRGVFTQLDGGGSPLSPSSINFCSRACAQSPARFPTRQIRR